MWPVSESGRLNTLSASLSVSTDIYCLAFELKSPEAEDWDSDLNYIQFWRFKPLQICLPTSKSWLKVQSVTLGEHSYYEYILPTLRDGWVGDQRHGGQVRHCLCLGRNLCRADAIIGQVVSTGQMTETLQEGSEKWSHCWAPEASRGGQPTPHILVLELHTSGWRKSATLVPLWKIRYLTNHNNSSCDLLSLCCVANVLWDISSKAFLILITQVLLTHFKDEETKMKGQDVTLYPSYR